MKAIYVYAWADLNRAGSFFPYHYNAIRHPVGEWANIFKADSLSSGFKVNKKLLNWSDYELAIVFDHDISIGSATLIRKLNPKIKIVMIPEPPPKWLLTREPFGLLPKLHKDCQSADLVAIAHECYVDDWRMRLRCNRLHFVPVPINIVEYEKCVDLSKRQQMIASTGHCNFAECSKRSWDVIRAAQGFLKGYRTRCFYAFDLAQLRALGTGYDEACGFDWNVWNHIKRLNECNIIVDDNISPASGHITLETACMGIPSVGSNDFISHLFPELGLPPQIINPPAARKQGEVEQLARKLILVATDENYYKQIVALGRQRLYATYSYEACKKRLMGLLE